MEVKRLITDAYVNVLLAEERKQILEKNLENLEGTLSDIRKVYLQGLVEVEQVEQLKITSSSIQSALDYINRLVPITQKMLNMALGRDLTDKVVLTDTLIGLCVQSETSNELTDWDIEKNIDYQIAQNNLRSSELLLNSSGSEHCQAFQHLSLVVMMPTTTILPLQKSHSSGMVALPLA